MKGPQQIIVNIFIQPKVIKQYIPQKVVILMFNNISRDGAYVTESDIRRHPGGELLELSEGRRLDHHRTLCTTTTAFITSALVTCADVLQARVYPIVLGNNVIDLSFGHIKQFD